MSVNRSPVDPSVTNRPIRFKLTARTDDPKYANSQGIPNLRLNPNKQKVNRVQQTQTLPMVYCGLHALEVTNLNVVANNFLRTCFKG